MDTNRAQIKGQTYYHFKRLGIVEPVFGNLAAQKGLNKSTLRGTTKVDGQWKLICMVQNLEKIARYGSGFN